MFLGRYIPITRLVGAYPRSWLTLDIVAGLTTGAVVIPKAMAMATVAGLPVEFGLYTVLLPMTIYALFGSSRRLSMSTTATIGMLSGAALNQATHGSDPGRLIPAAVTLSLLVGVALLLASVLKLGSIANFISDPVLTGFKIGLGLVIVADQAPKLLGLHIEKVSFGRDLVALCRHLPETSGSTVAVGGATLLMILALERFLPQSPAPLLAAAAGVIASGWIGLGRAGVSIVGHMPAGLPGFQFPHLDLMEELWPAGLGIALMSFTETIAVGRAFATASEPRPNPDQELRAIGFANIVGSLFHAMPAGGGTSQTAVNCEAGAKSQISELVTAGMAAIAVMFLAPIISLMPQATLAAVVITSSAGLMNPKELLQIRKLRHMEFWWGVSAATGVVLLGTLKGILVAVIVSLVALTYDSNRAPVYALARKPGTNVFRPRSAKHPEDEVFPGLLLVRTEGRMYFANAQRVGDRIWELVHENGPEVLVLDCSAIPDIEYTALSMLIRGEQKLRESGIELWVSGLNVVALDVVRRSSLGPSLGHDRMCFDVAEAVSRFQMIKTPARC